MKSGTSMTMTSKLIKVIKRSNYSTVVAVEALQNVSSISERAWLNDTVKPYSEIPGPRKLPFFGNSWRFAPLIGHYKIGELDKVMLSLREQYGKMVRVGGLLGHPDLVFAFSADAIETVFRREEVLPHRPSMPSLSHYKRTMRADFFGDNAGVIGVHGKPWDIFRAKVQQMMLQPSTARSFVGPLNDIAEDFINRIDDMRDDKGELPDQFLYEIYKWALESIGRVALDTRLGCLEPTLSPESEAQRIIDSINTFFWNVAEVELRLPLWRIYNTKSYKKYIGALDDFRELCMRHIKVAVERLEAQVENGKQNDGKADSLVESILRQHNNPKLAAVLALDLLLVGVDTTSVALSSTIYQLSQNVEAQERLRKELISALPSPYDPITAEVLEQLPYLKACIKETLRMYPVILGNGRCLQSDAIIEGYLIPKGTHIIFPHYVVSNEEEYIKDPKKFMPTRWMKSAECPHRAKIHPFVSLPFGFGRRTCLGKRFAEAELQIMLAKIFRKYQVNYNYGPLTYRVSPTYVPIEPLKFKLTPLNG